MHRIPPAITFLFTLLFFSFRIPTIENIILEDGKYFDGKKFLSFSEIVIREGKILSISAGKSNASGKRISVKNKYLIPGLIDSHVHFSGSPAFPYVYVNPLMNLNSSLQCGVTGGIDLFFPENGVKAFADSSIAYPDLYSGVIASGPILTAPGGHGTEYGVPTRTISSDEEAEKISEEVASKKEIGVIKLVYEAHSGKHFLSLAQVKKIVAAAHKHGKKVFAHINICSEAMDCIDAGVDVLAHIPYDLMKEADLVKLKESGVKLIPTITVYQSLLEGHDDSYMGDSLLWSSAYPDYLSGFERKALQKPPGIGNLFGKEPGYFENLKNCIRHGIPILAGTDAGNYAVFYGYSLHNELKTYCKAGMSNADALCAATSNINALLPELKIGKIEPGFWADIVVLESDPLKNIINTKKISFTLHQGKIIRPLNFSEMVKGLAIPVPMDTSIFNLQSLTSLPLYIYAYDDQVMGGGSSSELSLQKGTGTAWLSLRGKVVRKSFLAFAGFAIILSKEDERNVDLTAYTGVAFEARGNKEKYLFKAVSSQVKDFNFHSRIFIPDSEWKEVKLYFTEFSQNPFYGKKVKLDPGTITSIKFEAADKAIPIDLDIRNIRLIRK